MIAIIDYGMGNLASVKKALDYLKIENQVTNDRQVIEKAAGIVLPGVGSFYQGMQNLEQSGLRTVLSEQVLEKKKKFLGICLGMQLLMEKGTEPFDCEGLGWVKGSVTKFSGIDLPVPHMGWNNITASQSGFCKSWNDKDFYFIHSYHVVPSEEKNIVATVDYGYKVVAAIEKENIFATQFHPEKSQEAGLELLRTFFADCA
jgi:imidazole glycerol-phosphate synthase subunit HisH